MADFAKLKAALTLTCLAFVSVIAPATWGPFAQDAAPLSKITDAAETAVELNKRNLGDLLIVWRIDRETAALRAQTDALRSGRGKFASDQAAAEVRAMSQAELAGAAGAELASKALSQTADQFLKVFRSFGAVEAQNCTRDGSACNEVLILQNSYGEKQSLEFVVRSGGAREALHVCQNYDNGTARKCFNFSAGHTIKQRLDQSKGQWRTVMD